MSRVDLSPEQLDAMAAVRPAKRVGMPQGVQLSLAVLHASFSDESQIPRLTSSAPPVVRRPVEKREGKHHDYYAPPKDDWEEMEPADRIGRNLSAAMVQLIGAIEAEDNNYPPRYPVRRALAEWERTCRRRHRGSQWWDHATAPICGDMLRQVIEGGATVRWCAEFTGIPYPRAERLIGSGAAFVAERLQRWEDERQGIAHDREHCVVCREEAG